MTDLTHQIKHARPRIDAVSPIVGKSVLGFALFNMVLGVLLFTLKSHINPEFSLIVYLYQYKLWGVLFFCLGAVKLCAYTTNNWWLMKRSILIAVFFKLMWTFALAFSFMMGDHDNAIVLILWLLVTHLQVLTFIYFTPKGVRGLEYGTD